MRKVILLYCILSVGYGVFAQHLIGSGDLSACTGNLFDTGGSSSDYSNSENITETYCSNNGDCIEVGFSAFDLESGYDYLYIYDGSSTSDPLIGQYSGSSLPNGGSILSSTGCLTFRFTSDGSAVYSGWEASISCGACPTCDDPSDLSVSNILYNGVDLSWTENGTATQWDIEWGLTGFVPTGTPDISATTSNPYTLTGLIESTDYDFYVRSNCGGALVSNWVGPFSFSTIAPPAGSTCGNPNTLSSLPFSAMGMSTNGFGDDYSSANACGSSYMNGDDYVFEYTPSGCEELSISINNADTYTGLFLTEGCPTTGSCVVSSTGSTASITSQLLQGGQTYYILISTWPAPQTTSFDISISSVSISCPGDDPCSAIATSTDCGAKVYNAIGGFTNSGVTDPSCGDYQGGDLWYELTIPASGTVDVEGVSVVSGVSDIALAAYTAASCGGGKTLIQCNDGGAGSGMASLSLSGLTAGNTLYVRVWEPGNDASGQFELEFTDPSSLYCLSGDATMYNFPTDTCMQVSADAGDQKGCAWYQNTLDFSVAFDHTLEVYLGDDDGGADGMTFVFHNDPLGTSVCGDNGGGLGAQGIQNALVVEIDTYDNDNPAHIWDISEDHIAVWTTSSGYQNPIAGPISATNPAVDIEDGAVHELRLVWNPFSNSLDIYFDGVFRLSASGDFVNDVFGSKNVFWGSTAATGLYTNQMYVCPPPSLINPSLSQNNFDFEFNCLGNEGVELNLVNQKFNEVEYLEVQKSLDGINFNIVKRLTEESSFVVNNLKNKSFIRLLRKTKSGQVFYSKVKKVNCLDENIFDVWVENGGLIFSMKEVDELEYRVFSLGGKLMVDGVINESFGKVDVSNFSAGLYFVEMKSGVNHKVEKVFVKNIAE